MIEPFWVITRGKSQEQQYCYYSLIVLLGCPESSERFCGTYSVSRYKINVKSIGNFC
jgi:hypothetical protein